MKAFFALIILFVASVSEAKPQAYTGVVLNNEKVTVWNTYYRTGVRVCRLEKATQSFDCSFSRYEQKVVWCDVKMQPKGCQFDPYGPRER